MGLSIFQIQLFFLEIIPCFLSNPNKEEKIDHNLTELIL